jgi:hypothetical protein
MVEPILSSLHTLRALHCWQAVRGRPVALSLVITEEFGTRLEVAVLRFVYIWSMFWRGEWVLM